MAGIQWGGKAKLKKFDVKRDFMHCDNEERKKRTHKNEDIDITKTDLNISAFKLSYKETCEKYDKRIKPIIKKTIEEQLKSPNGKKTIRKDAVFCVAPMVWIPSELSYEQSIQFSNHIFEYFKKKFGDNYINGYAHFDEQHIYIDPTTKKERLSQGHLHNFIIPEVDGVLNNKKLVDRKLINEINKDVEDYTFKTFGVHYVKGEGTKSRKTVEDLKNESYVEKNKLIRENSDTETKLHIDNNEIKKNNSDKDLQDKLNEDKKAFDDEHKRLQEIYINDMNKVNDANSKLNEVNSNIENVKKDLNDIQEERRIFQENFDKNKKELQEELNSINESIKNAFIPKNIINSIQIFFAKIRNERTKTEKYISSLQNEFKKVQQENIDLKNTIRKQAINQNHFIEPIKVLEKFLMDKNISVKDFCENINLLPEKDVIELGEKIREKAPEKNLEKIIDDYRKISDSVENVESGILIPDNINKDDDPR